MAPHQYGQQTHGAFLPTAPGLEHSTASSVVDGDLAQDVGMPMPLPVAVPNGFGDGGPSGLNPSSGIPLSFVQGNGALQGSGDLQGSGAPQSSSLISSLPPTAPVSFNSAGATDPTVGLVDGVDMFIRREDGSLERVSMTSDTTQPPSEPDDTQVPVQPAIAAPSAAMSTKAL